MLSLTNGRLKIRGGRLIMNCVDSQALTELDDECKSAEVFDSLHLYKVRNALHEWLKPIADSKYVHNLTALCITETLLSAQNMGYLCSALTQSDHLKSLQLNYCMLTYERSIRLTEYLKVTTQLQHLALIGNPLKDNAITAITQAMSATKSITHLNLNHCLCNHEGIKALGNLIRNNTGIKYLSISHNEIEIPGAIIFAQQLNRKNGLILLDISCNNFDYNDRLEAILWGSIRNSPSLVFMYIYKHRKAEQYVINAELFARACGYAAIVCKIITGVHTTPFSIMPIVYDTLRREASHFYGLVSCFFDVEQKKCKIRSCEELIKELERLYEIVRSNKKSVLSPAHS